MNLLELQKTREATGKLLYTLLPAIDEVFRTNTNKDIQGQLNSLVADGKVHLNSNFYKFTKALLDDYWGMK